jgi:hypothetical protein
MGTAAGSSKEIRHPTTYRSWVLSFVKGWLPIISVCVYGGWQLYKYKVERSDTTRSQAEARRIDAQRPFLTKQLDIFLDTAKTVGTLASLEPNTFEWKVSANRFWSLRWSELEMVGDPGIREAMRRIEYAIVEVQKNPNEDTKHYLRWMIECLADEMRLSLEYSWGTVPKSEKTASNEIRQNLPSGCFQGREGPPPLPLPPAPPK